MTNQEAINILKQHDIECSCCNSNDCLDTNVCLVSEALEKAYKLLSENED